MSVNEIIKMMFKVISRPEKKRHQSNQCQKCAVVGNSGNLLQSKYGDLINNHSVVFRYASNYSTFNISKVFGNLFIF